MLQTIAASKDRPPQLELLLRTDAFSTKIAPGARRLTVLWTATTDEARQGYAIVQEQYPATTFREERDFTADYKDIFQDDIPFAQFLTDDDLFIRPWSMSDDEFNWFVDDPRVTSLALRMGATMDYSYTLNIVTPPPVMLTRYRWLWPGLLGDWGYPNSVDGNVYRTQDIIGAVRDPEKYSPSHFEPGMRKYLRRPLLMCYPEPRLINIAGNSVQTVAPTNRNQCTNQQQMNRWFLEGRRIDPQNIMAAEHRSPHVAMDYKWTAS